MAEPIVPSDNAAMMEAAERQLRKRLLRERQLDPTTTPAAGQADGGVPLLTRPFTVGTSDFLPHDMELRGPAPEPPKPDVEVESIASPSETALEFGQGMLIQKLRKAFHEASDEDEKARIGLQLQKIRTEMSGGREAELDSVREGMRGRLMQRLLQESDPAKRAEWLRKINNVQQESFGR